MLRIVVAAAGAAALTLAACGPDEIEPEADMDGESTMEAVREDAAALAESTGEAMKEGVEELKEGAEDVGQMMKEAGSEMKEAVDSDAEAK